MLLGMLVTMQSLVMLRPALRHELGPSGPKGPGLVKFIYCETPHPTAVQNGVGRRMLMWSGVCGRRLSF